MFDKAFDNMQEIGKQWAAFGRKVTREALSATSTSLESAARYLKNLGEKVADARANGEEAAEAADETDRDTGASDARS